MKGESFSEKRCLAFGYFLPGELEEGRSGHETAIALVEASSLGAEIEYRSAIPGGGKLKFIGASSIRLSAAHHGARVIDANVIRLPQIQLVLVR